MRYMAIDLGQKRTGVAIGDDRTRIVSPITVIQTASDTERLRRIEKLVQEHEPDALVVGIPFNMDGTEGPPAKAARVWAQQLQQTFERPVHLVDERLTSAAAESQLDGSGRTHKKKRELRDALAAAAILRDFLHHGKDET